MIELKDKVEFKDDHVKEIKRGDIFWFKFDDVFLPALVIQNNKGNKFSENTIIIKMNSSKSLENKNKYIPTIASISKHEIIGTPKKLNSLKDEGYILASDVYTIPKSSLKSYIGSLLPSSFKKVDNALIISLGIEI